MFGISGKSSGNSQQNSVSFKINSNNGQTEVVRRSVAYYYSLLNFIIVIIKFDNYQLLHLSLIIIIIL